MKQETSKQVFHNSKLIIINGLIQPLMLLLILFSNDIIETIHLLKKVDTFDSKQILLIAGICGFLIIAMIFCALRNLFIWKNTYITLDQNEIFYQKRTLFNQKSRHANLENITNVTLDSSLFARLLGLKKVTIDINTTTTAEEDDFAIALEKNQAVGFQTMINDLRKQSAQVHNKEKQDVPQVQENKPEALLSEKHFSIQDTTKHILLDSLGSVIVVTLIAVGVVCVYGQYIDFSFRPADLAIGIFPALLFIYDILKQYNKSFNFFVGRSDKNIYLSYGLTHKTEYMIPVKNIVSISTKQTILSKIFGYQYVKVETIGITDNSSSLCLFMKNDQIPGFVENFIPEFPLYRETVRRPIAVIWYFLVRNLFILVPVGLIVDYTIPMVHIAAYIAAVLSVLMTICNYVAHGYQIVEEGVVIRTGLAAGYELIPFKNMEQIEIKTNPYYEKTGVEQIAFFIRDSNGKRQTRPVIYHKGAFDHVILKQQTC